VGGTSRGRGRHVDVHACRHDELSLHAPRLLVIRVFSSTIDADVDFA
jgi:hypothetical protein